MAKGRFKVEWYGPQVLNAIRNMTEAEEKAAAERVMQRAKRYVPVGTKIVATPPHGKPWMSRYPGRLKSTIRTARSKFEKGGWLVWAGNELAYYARFVEFGTVYMKSRKGIKFMRRAATMERSYFIRQLRKRLGV